MFYISASVSVPRSQIEISPIRASGPGGQNVNKVSSAVHLRFDIPGSSLSDDLKEKLLKINDRRISSDGVIVIKAQRHRSLEKNIEDGLERLKVLIGKALLVQKKRRPTRPSKSAKTKRVDSKTRRGRVKKLRGRVDD